MHYGSPVVLIIDSEPETLAVYALALLALGFQPLTANGAEEAFVRAPTVRPDVIVINATLRDGSGWDLIPRLRDDGRASRAVVLLLSPDSTSVEPRAGKAGIDRVVSLPCEPDVLAMHIWELLNLRRRDP